MNSYETSGILFYYSTLSSTVYVKADWVLPHIHAHLRCKGLIQLDDSYFKLNII